MVDNLQIKWEVEISDAGFEVIARHMNDALMKECFGPLTEGELLRMCGDIADAACQLAQTIARFPKATPEWSFSIKLEGIKAAEEITFTPDLFRFFAEL